MEKNNVFEKTTDMLREITMSVTLVTSVFEEGFRDSKKSFLFKLDTNVVDSIKRLSFEIRQMRMSDLWMEAKEHLGDETEEVPLALLRAWLRYNNEYSKCKKFLSKLRDYNISMSSKDKSSGEYAGFISTILYEMDLNKEEYLQDDPEL